MTSPFSKAHCSTKLSPDLLSIYYVLKILYTISHVILTSPLTIYDIFILSSWWEIKSLELIRYSGSTAHIWKSSELKTQDYLIEKPIPLFFMLCCLFINISCVKPKIFLSSCPSHIQTRWQLLEIFYFSSLFAFNMFETEDKTIL